MLTCKQVRWIPVSRTGMTPFLLHFCLKVAMFLQFCVTRWNDTVGRLLVSH
ncbi:hypothetical protein [Wolbachia endosymbiont of Folsomia candida]|uniref:hypothetical protein n=1 Tax=Wolbachia endosymbiont of Folsomia candida TaxID=169402 RepID=UPI000B05CF4B|nr:hypothetical protein [Wolbachia endosymbiont of Folsomia candida]